MSGQYIACTTGNSVGVHGLRLKKMLLNNKLMSSAIHNQDIFYSSASIIPQGLSGRGSQEGKPSCNRSVFQQTSVAFAPRENSSCSINTTYQVIKNEKQQQVITSIYGSPMSKLRAAGGISTEDHSEDSIYTPIESVCSRRNTTTSMVLTAERIKKKQINLVAEQGQKQPTHFLKKFLERRTGFIEDQQSPLYQSKCIKTEGDQPHESDMSSSFKSNFFSGYFPKHSLMHNINEQSFNENYKTKNNTSVVCENQKHKMTRQAPRDMGSQEVFSLYLSQLPSSSNLLRHSISTIAVHPNLHSSETSYESGKKYDWQPTKVDSVLTTIRRGDSLRQQSEETPVSARNVPTSSHSIGKVQFSQRLESVNDHFIQNKQSKVSNMNWSSQMKVPLIEELPCIEGSGDSTPSIQSKQNKRIPKISSNLYESPRTELLRMSSFASQACSPRSYGLLGANRKRKKQQQLLKEEAQVKQRKFEEIAHAIEQVASYINELKSLYNSEVQLSHVVGKIPGFNNVLSCVVYENLQNQLQEGEKDEETSKKKAQSMYHQRTLRSRIDLPSARGALIEHFLNLGLLPKSAAAALNQKVISSQKSFKKGKVTAIQSNISSSSLFESIENCQLSEEDVLGQLQMKEVDDVLIKLGYFMRCIHSLLLTKREDHVKKQIDELKSEIVQISTKTQLQIRSIQTKVSANNADIEELSQMGENIAHILDRRNYQRQQPFIEKIESKEEALGSFKRISEANRVQSKCLNKLSDILRNYHKYAQ